MTTKSVAVRESFYIALLASLLIFMWLNFDSTLGSIFMAMLLVGAFLRLADFTFVDRKVNIPLVRHNLFKSALYGAIAYVCFLGISSIVMGVLGKTNLFSMGSVLLLLAEAQPVFAGSIFLTFVGWAILIPNVETYFSFGTMIEYIVSAFGKKFNIQLSPFNLGFIFLSIILGVGFAFFHLTAKIGLGEAGFNEALILVFLFGFISAMVVGITKEIMAAIVMHVIANSISIGLSFALFTTAQLLLYGGIAFGLLFVLTKSWNIKFTRG